MTASLQGAAKECPQDCRAVTEEQRVSPGSSSLLVARRGEYPTNVIAPT